MKDQLRLVARMVASGYRPKADLTEVTRRLAEERQPRNLDLTTDGQMHVDADWDAWNVLGRRILVVTL